MKNNDWDWLLPLGFVICIGLCLASIPITVESVEQEMNLHRIPVLPLYQPYLTESGEIGMQLNLAPILTIPPNYKLEYYEYELLSNGEVTIDYDIVPVE